MGHSGRCDTLREEYPSPENGSCQSYLSPLATNLGQKSWGEDPSEWWAEGVDRQKVYENLGDDFGRQRQYRVLVGIESLLYKCFFDSQRRNGALEVQNPSFEICDASTICRKRAEHGDCWESGSVYMYGSILIQTVLRTVEFSLVALGELLVRVIW
jgi:hypothetical protein